MKLIVGLGNPGTQYENTRHNCGFIAIDHIANSLNISVDQSKFKGLYGKGKYKGEDVIILKPMTYMNLSGESIIEAIKFFKIDIEDIVVIYDDMSLVLGKVRLRSKGSAGGHNGIKSIIQHLHTDVFNRIKVGIGQDKQMDTVDFVLGRFSKDELEALEHSFMTTSRIVEKFISGETFSELSKFLGDKQEVQNGKETKSIKKS